jgi:two-component system sensor histidine kinase/response regulator
MHEGIFDFERSLRRLDGDRELYRDLIRFFLEDSPKLLDQLRAGLASHDVKSMCHAAHTLKGLAGNFHAQRAVQAADRVEEQAADLHVGSEAVAQLEEEFDLLQQALRALQSELT